MSPDEFVVPAARAILSSTVGWMGESTVIDYDGLIKLGLMGVGAGISAYT